MKHFIQVKNLIYRYKLFKEGQEAPIEKTALDRLSLSVAQGDFIGILGPNGSGKSTLARQLAALLSPAQGVVLIKGKSTTDQSAYEEVRRTVTMVFQNPDNQIIGTTVEEDLAFGPGNMGCESEEIDHRISHVLEAVGLEAYRFHRISELSGGQKQRTAIAGVLAMEPECIIFDEPTAMIDPEGRDEILRAVRSLNRDKGITILYISHDPEEVKDADYLYVMKEGRLLAEGKPLEIFSQKEYMTDPDYDLPCFCQVRNWLSDHGAVLPSVLLPEEEFLAWLSGGSKDGRQARAMLKRADLSGALSVPPAGRLPRVDPGEENISMEAGSQTVGGDSSAGLVLDHISYTYPRLGLEAFPPALKDVSLQVRSGEFLAIVGRSGSGKTTLLKHMNGLVRPDQGQVLFHGSQIWAEDYSRKELRQKIVYCFQYPENQLFEETVFEDVLFGPKNMKLDAASCERLATQALQAVGLDRDLWQDSPLTLSGGQKRRAALAGVIAMEPEYLILDEPTAGLDRAGKRRIFQLLHKLNREKNMTIILVTHSMEDAAAHADRLLVMGEGRILMDGQPEQVFQRRDILKEAGLKLPGMASFYDRLFPDMDSMEIKAERGGGLP